MWQTRVGVRYTEAVYNHVHCLYLSHCKLSCVPDDRGILVRVKVKV